MLANRQSNYVCNLLKDALRGLSAPAVGFKVNNERAVQFRKWANTIVKDYTIQGWVMDEERLKKGGSILTKVAECKRLPF